MFLRACRQQPVPHTPVWFMRQAGRYMPEYRAIRERSSFLDMCKTPDLAVEITLQPVRALGVDAAILFSDILIPIEPMGIPIEFNPGPVLPQPVRSRAQIDALRVPEPRESVPFVLEALRRLRAELPAHVALIGFCGAPWTLANYAVEGGGAKEFTGLKRLIYEDPEAAQQLLSKLADTNAVYLRAQFEAGADAVQIFDTWAGIADRSDLAEWVLPYVQQMIRAIRAASKAPVIYFARDCAHALDVVAQAGADVYSVDWRTPLGEARRVFRTAVQGNLDPAALFAPWPVLERKVLDVLEEAGDQPGHVFNLGHGILQGTPVDNVRRVVELVHQRTQGRR
jgi:uroporphyrinogen decarboxylase